MSIQKPALPKGTRDFGPDEMARRNYILEIIKGTFRLFGFQELETPAMENLSTLTGKYGDEGDQLLFKVLNSGDFLKKVSLEDFSFGANALLPKVAEKGLRYDLTVPFARYVVMHRNEITFPFKRFQVQPVWRADRPQKGRYREFFQCDADVVGTDSLICEAEILLMIKKVFTALRLKDYSIKINNRKILTGIAEEIGEKGKENSLCVAIDKLDKIGWENVQGELNQRGFSRTSIQLLEPVVRLPQDGNGEKIKFLKELLKNNETGLSGLREIEEVLGFLSGFGEDQDKINFDPMLARGLSYYTGAIFEVQVNNVAIGSVSGGGRYDNLTGVFGLPGVSGVGFSFGVDRLYDVLETLNLFPENNLITTGVMVAYFEDQQRLFGLKVVQQIRKEGIPAEIYPEAAKIKKQFNYADKKNIPFVIIIGSEELDVQQVTVKNMRNGTQQRVSIQEAIKIVKQ